MGFSPILRTLLALSVVGSHMEAAPVNTTIRHNCAGFFMEAEVLYQDYCVDYDESEVSTTLVKKT